MYMYDKYANVYDPAEDSCLIPDISNQYRCGNVKECGVPHLFNIDYLIWLFFTISAIGADSGDG